ncbi:hypothetical protein QM012_006228 [Aureobasidium pullulans]|uniref:Uncharacterized protein n=1 Tax=Aureobasidium pullulans TaxID=5580 RepID=A0ABR0TTQ0_AURPU
MSAYSSDDESQTSTDCASSNEERIIDYDGNDTEEPPIDDVLSAHIAAEIDLVTSSKSNVDDHCGIYIMSSSFGVSTDHVQGTPTLDESITDALFSHEAKRDLRIFANRRRQYSRPSPSSQEPGLLNNESSRNAWNVAAARLLSKATNGNFTDANLISWSHSMKAPLGLLLHYPPEKGTPDHGTTYNPMNVCIKALMRKFGSLEDCFMMNLVPIRCQRHTGVSHSDQRFCQPYMQFGPEVWAECIRILRNALSQMEAEIIICFGKCVADLIKWLHPKAKRLTFGNQPIFGSKHHVLAVYSDAGVIERMFFICYHPEALLYPQDPLKLAMLDQMVNMCCALAGLVGFNPTSFVDTGRIARPAYVRAVVSAPMYVYWEQRVLRYGRLVALCQMRREEIRYSMKIRTEAIPATLLLELYAPTPPNIHGYTWLPHDFEAKSAVHEIIIKLVFRLPPTCRDGPLIDGDNAQMTYRQHLSLIELAGTPRLNDRQIHAMAHVALSTKAQVKEAEKWVAAVVAPKPNSESLAKLALQHKTSDNNRRQKLLDKALREEADRLGVSTTKELPAGIKAKIRLDRGLAPCGKLERRSSMIVSDDLPLLLSGHDMVIEYNKRMFIIKRKNQQILESLVLDMQAAQSDVPDALLNRLLSQISPATAADLLEPDLQIR